MLFFWMILAAVAGAFGATLLVGAPYLPTRRGQASQAFALLELKSGQVFYDLGCGDGRLLRAAAKQGAHAIGYELNPLLFLLAWLLSLAYPGQIEVKFGNFWQADISDADAIFIFLLGKYMKRFDNFMNNQAFKSAVKLVSYSFKIPGKKTAGQEGPMYLYNYGQKL